MGRFLRVCLFVAQLLAVLVLARYVDDLGWGIYLLVVAGSSFALFLVLGYQWRRIPGERAAPAAAPASGHDEDQLRRQLLARLAFDMRAPIVTAARAVTALRDKSPAPVAPSSTLSPPTEDDGISWAP